MEFRILGPFEVVEGDRQVALPRGRGRALLALLVLRAGEVVSTEHLIDLLWGEAPPPTARTALHGFVSTLRKRLQRARGAGAGGAVLQTRLPGYVLAVERGQVDAHRCRRLLEEAAGAPAAERAAKLRTALSLWRGTALADFTYEPFAQTDIAVLEELRLTAIEERIDADLALGRHAELVGELERLIAEQPLRERLRGQLMLALYRSGQQVKALEVYRATHRALVEELGIEPGPALQALEQSILRQDESLDLQPAPPPSEVSRDRPAAGLPPVLSAVEGVEAQPWLPPGRKTVTVAFVDLSQATSPGASLDPEALRRIVRQHVQTAADVITRHGGSIEEQIGDTVVAIFGLPAAHEDDALRAVRTVIELRSALAAVDEELARAEGIRLVARAGIATGEVVVGDPAAAQPIASGEAITLAARLQQAAAEGEILVSESTRRLVGDAALLEPSEHLALEIHGQPVSAWRLLDVVPCAPPLASRLDAPLVGRAAELARLRAAFDRTVQGRRARLFAVVGEPGIGKSRLAREFAASLGSDALVLVGHCPAYGEGMTFWPLREMVMQVAGTGRGHLLGPLAGDDDAQSIADQLAGAIGLTETSGRPDTPFPAIRRIFQALARRRPVAVIFEDVHWAQPTLLDLVEYLVEWTREAVFLLCLARPELIEARPAWGGGTRNADMLFLEPLSPTETEKLIARRLGGGTLPTDTLARIVQTSQGNPLFAEQMVAAFREQGAVSLPASVHALLAARLDRLGPAERDLLRCAAVVGADFSVDALMALVPERARAHVHRHLQVLERKQLIRPARAVDKGFSFRHGLIQLAAYRSIAREDRAALHQRFAEWLEGETRERPPELDEVVGYHLEQAVEQRRAIAMPEEHDPALAARAGEYLTTAGLRAWHRYDMAEAANLLSRASALLPSTHRERRPIMRHLAEAYQVLGRPSEADSVLATMLAESEAEGDRWLTQVARLERARAAMFVGPDPTSLRSIREEAERALDVFGESADDAGLALAYYVLALVHFRTGEMREMERVAGRGLTHADRSGRPREAMAARMMVAWALVAGPTPVPEGIRLCEQLVPVLGLEHPLTLCDVANLQAMLGEVHQARELIARARRLTLERIRGRSALLLVAQSSASVELLAGDLGAAERELRVALDLGLDAGLRESLAHTAARLSLILSVRVDLGEAEQLASLSRDKAPAESVAAQALWRSAKARVLGNHGDHAEAERLVREAIQLVTDDMLNLGADLRVDLAEVLLAAGRREAALPVIGEAIDLYERKVNLVSAARARSLAQHVALVAGR